MKESLPGGDPDAAPPMLAPEEAAPGSTAAQLTETDIEALKTEAAKAAEHWDRFLRVTADFDNYRKRAAREREEARAFANQALLEKLLPVLDNFEAARNASARFNSEEARSLQSGVDMIHQSLKATLQQAGVEEIDALGQPFDPTLHEALSQMESSEVPEGNVLHQARKGYRLHGRLLRPAGVVVAHKPAA